ncbi:3-hydroxyacyl-CoA dehydrogenase family protein [Salinibacterium sp. NG253]|uniref:3-hydroxyacyl-CoA dehydrogenase family protein n=1 Tax=Salinibacterium sp. NG253 TaxID=2792039 RepID=UPI0018CDE12A|nr:3-hydroxyacyl-CoA dehydrogenase family protein [Salinibacterium sp. NG253]MBH0116792.1 3-hydroxyacyl-CoA dehydrogenase family protein [Salinibacterium sp. NG253]
MSNPVIGVVGLGLMGRAIAERSAAAGLQVRGYDSSVDAREAIAKWAASVGSEELLIAGRLNELADCDFIIEAVSESLETKLAVMRAIGNLNESATIMTNSSTYMASELAPVVRNPSRLIVGHFFNPAQVAPLVEVIPGPATDPDTVARAVDYLTQIGKIPIVLSAETPGFVANRLQAALLRECFALIDQGVCTPQQLDEVVRLSLAPRWAALGPLAVADLGGLDVFAALTARLYPLLDARTTVSPLLDSLAETKHYGAKTGSGIYCWNSDLERGAIEAASAALRAASPRAPLISATPPRPENEDIE